MGMSSVADDVITFRTLAVESGWNENALVSALQIGGTDLSAAKKEGRRESCCIYCSKPGHFQASCPKLLGKKQARGMVVTGISSSMLHHGQSG